MQRTLRLSFLIILFIIGTVLIGYILTGCSDDDDDDTSITPTVTPDLHTPTPTQTPNQTPVMTPTATPTPADDRAEVKIWTKPIEVTGNMMVLTNTLTMEEWHFINSFESFLDEGPYRLEAFASDTWLPEIPCQELYFLAGEYYGIEVVYYYNAQEGNLVGDRAYNFTLNDRYETPHSLYNYWGRVILLDISACWCAPCQAEAAQLEALYQQYKNQGFIILTVLIEDATGGQPDAADCAYWADTYGLTFPVLYDVNYSVWYLFNTTNYIPLNLIIDRNMIIRYKDTGYFETEIRSMIESLL